VAFATGGIVDAVADAESGRLVAVGGYRALSEAIVNVLRDGTDAWAAAARRFACSFSWPLMGERLAQALGVHCEPARNSLKGPAE
jgi:phosphatidylinositol alpha-1,6-mannosyltransferase